jgi:hypothetical protein
MSSKVEGKDYHLSRKTCNIQDDYIKISCLSFPGFGTRVSSQNLVSCDDTMAFIRNDTRDSTTGSRHLLVPEIVP